MPRKVNEQAGSIDRCSFVFINLKHRIDRRTDIEGELRRMGVRRYKRFDAIAAKPGALGCAMSHLEVLKSATVRPGRMLMVLEDDAEFLITPAQLELMLERFADSKGDVLCPAFHTAQVALYSEHFHQGFDLRTMACYVVKPHMVEPMIGIAEKSVKMLKVRSFHP